MDGLMDRRTDGRMDGCWGAGNIQIHFEWVYNIRIQFYLPMMLNKLNPAIIQ